MGCPPWLPPRLCSTSSWRWLVCRRLALFSGPSGPLVLHVPLPLFQTALDRCCLQLFWMNSSLFDVRKTQNLKSLKIILLSSTKPSSETFDRSTSSVMEYLWRRQGLLRKKWCCAWGWWMMGGQAYRRRYMEPRFLLSLSTPHQDGHTLVTDNYINTTIQPYNWTRRVYERTKPGNIKHIPW